MLASIVKIPELAIDEGEAKTLAAAVARVSKHYDTKVSAKTIDHLALAQVAVMIYGPRMLMLRTAKKKAPEPPPNPQPSFMMPELNLEN